MRTGPARTAAYDTERLTLADCVISIEGITKGKDWPAAWKPKDRSVRVVRRDEWIEQRVQVARAGTQVVFDNPSPSLCTVRGFRDGFARQVTCFNFGLGPDVMGLVVAEAWLEHPGATLITADTDDALRSWVHLFDHPYVSGPTPLDGGYAIADIPPGTWTVTAWHEGIGVHDERGADTGRRYRFTPPLIQTTTITVEPGQDVVLDFTFPVADAWAAD